MFSVPVPIGEGSPTLRRRVARGIRVNGATGCWEWTKAYSLKNRGRRPVVQLGGRGTRVVLVARLVLQWFQGPPPTDLHEAGHTCPAGENEKCIRPSHLRWMTRTENEHHKRSYREPTSTAASARSSAA